MWDRRRALQAGLATIGSLSVAAPYVARAQTKPLAKVRYSEVVHSILYAPSYVAMAKGYFEEASIQQTMTTVNAGDKTGAALISGIADIALIGPETAIYVQISDSPTKIPIFCGLTTTDGFQLIGRKKVENFDWSTLKGKDVLGYRPGSTPLLFFEAALRKKGIDPYKDIKLTNNILSPAARMGSWLAGQNEYAIFIEPDASQLELDGNGYMLGSIGEVVGFADYTTFMARDQYIRENPAIIQNWTNAITKAMHWTAAAPTEELTKTLEPFFPGVNPKALLGAVERYRKLKIWKTTPVVEPAAFDKFQGILIEGHVLDADKRVKYADLFLTEFADKAK